MTLLKPAGIIASARVVSAPPSLTHTYKTAIANGTDLFTYTFAAVDIGPASSTRRVVVPVGWAQVGPVLTSVTIGGVAATIDLDSGALIGNRRIAMASAVVPSGTTADIVVVFGGSTATARMGIGVWTLSSGSATGNTDNKPNVSSGTLTVTTLPGDVVIAAGFSSDTSGDKATTWSGTDVTARFDIDVENTSNLHSGADVVATGTSTAIGFATTAVAQKGFIAVGYR